MDLQPMLDAWKVDSKIDETNLILELCRTPQLHATYLNHYVNAKNMMTTAERDFLRLGNLKRKYYKGEMTRDELTKLSWDQYTGLKPSHSEMNSLLEFDVDMIKKAREVNDAKTFVSTTEYILKQIAQRDYSLKSIIEVTKYLNGG